MPQWPTGSRLERMILRLTVQRDCLDFVANHLLTVPGGIIELGLGKGRTYDHLRKLFPRRKILAFDRELHAMPDCLPPDKDLVLGEFTETLANTLDLLPQPAALIHADVGSEKRDRDTQLVVGLAPLVVPILQPGGILLTDRPWQLPQWQTLALPLSEGGWPYFGYQKPR
ncbi:MAG TPA: hypothetical protein ENI62_06680 [Gammaproteobacteria bacterium]|nr:hypothetical protein [Gammaproteobacteria bacterium]